MANETFEQEVKKEMASGQIDPTTAAMEATKTIALSNFWVQFLLNSGLTALEAFVSGTTAISPAKSAAAVKVIEDIKAFLATP